MTVPGRGVGLRAPAGAGTRQPVPAAQPVRAATAAVPGGAGRAAALDRWVALGAVALVGARLDLRSGITAGLLAALALVPVWVPVLRRHPGARLTVGLAVLATGWGLALPRLRSVSPTVDANVRTHTTVLLLGVATGVGVVLWARLRAGLRNTGLAYGLGMCVSAVLAAPTDNIWKFTWGVPVAVVLLSLVAQRRKLVQVAAFGALVLASAAFDSRSYLATFALAALLLVWPLRPRRRPGPWAWVGASAVLAGIALAVYQLGEALLVSGYLGREAQLRSVQQIDTTGSLILGGRPELAATAALLRAYPMGFGSGWIPDSGEVAVAKRGLLGIGFEPDNGYVDRYLFGGHVELHSLVGDLWASFGVPGLVLLVVIALVTLRALTEGVLRNTVTGLEAFLAVWALWNLLFSPLYASAPTLTLWFGLALATRARGPLDPIPPAPVPPARARATPVRV